MQTTFVINGKVKLVLIPESESEKTLLREFKSSTVSVDRAIDGITILGKSIPDAIILTTGDTDKVNEKLNEDSTVKK